MTDQSLTYQDVDGAAANPKRSKASAFLRVVTATGKDPSALVLRFALAIAIFPHGAQKLLGWFGGAGFSGTVAGFEQYFGIAAPLAIIAIITEFFAPLALVLGLFTRAAAFGIGAVMLVALRFHTANGFFMNWYGNQAGEGFEYHLLAIGVAIALVIKGAGRWSLDRRISGDR